MGAVLQSSTPMLPHRRLQGLDSLFASTEVLHCPPRRGELKLRARTHRLATGQLGAALPKPSHGLGEAAQPQALERSPRRLIIVPTDRAQTANGAIVIGLLEQQGTDGFVGKQLGPHTGIKALELCDQIQASDCL